MSYDNNLQVIWNKVISDNPKAPPMEVQVEIDGKRYKTGLWPWEKKDGTKITTKAGAQKYKGKLQEDTWEPNKAAAPEPSDVPF